ncbi:MAG: GAF domain-containing protein, partial [Anaerolineae bacterium]|nr:GAF domain-containing protein [Anaerolineae bacterium]
MGSNNVFTAAGTSIAALQGSMQAVLKALESGTIRPDQVMDRIADWRQAIVKVTDIEAQSSELGTLYEISRALNASLDLNDTINQVIDSLIRLTGAERGFLMLLDDDGNLDISAARNFDKENIAPTDLDLSYSVVRSALASGESVMIADAQMDPRFADRESIIEYNLRSIVCVPMEVHGHKIGALYLDNRVQEGVFSKSEMWMVTAFANQAAVAIENARLYTTTDRALAARLTELTTLQQVDRELNASLDSDRVMDLTLTYAIASTGAKRGSLSILDPDGDLHEIASSDDQPMVPGELDELEFDCDTHEPIVVGGSRLLVPIRLENRTVGLLYLKHDDQSFAADDIQFASRLADHAAVAIQNSRLYEEVQEANRAKSEFVSFIAHELRTPMTSIKGYADLLKKGTGGALSDMQSQFVDMLTSNVDRMQMLVSDLQDVSRIEAGQLRLDCRATALQSALDAAVRVNRAQIEARNQELVLDTADDLPKVYGDPSRLEQILINLLSNANKYTPEAGRIEVATEVEDNSVRCSVADNGLGISKEDQRQLFTKYFRSASRAVR